MQGQILFFLPVLLATLLCISVQLTNGQEKQLQCWQCHNGYKASKECEKGPTAEVKDTGQGSGAEVTLITHVNTGAPGGSSVPGRAGQDQGSTSNGGSSEGSSEGSSDQPDDNSASAPEQAPPGSKVSGRQALERAVNASKGCKEVVHFFVKYNQITNEWTKRNMPKGKGRNVLSGSREPFCASVLVFATARASAAEVYRDCILGTRAEIEDGFKDFLEVNVKLPSEFKVDQCWAKEVGAEAGVKKAKVCLCNANKCNVQTYSGIPRNNPSATYIVFAAIAAAIRYVF